MNKENNNEPVDFDELEKIEQSFLSENIIGEKDYILEEGNLKILLSAPHTVKQLRNGKIKASESRTGIIIMLLRRILSCPIIYKIRNENNDANFDEESSYRDELIDFAIKRKIGCVLDFHISAPSRPYSIEIGTGYGENICGRKDLLEIIVEELKKVYNNITIDSIFPASYANTVSATVGKKAKIPAFQIEINWSIISDYNKMIKFVDCFVKVIETLEEKLETVDNI